MDKEKIGNFHRNSILDVADRLFIEHGFEGTTVETIARESCYSKPTVYAYFQSKEEIFACGLLRRMRIFRDKLKLRVDENERTVDAYLACCAEIVELKTEYPVYFSGIMGSLDYGRNKLSEDTAKSIRGLSIEINALMKSLFSKAEREGIIAQETDVDFAYSYIWSCIAGIVSSPILGPDRFGGGEAYRKVLDKCFMCVINAFIAR